MNKLNRFLLAATGLFLCASLAQAQGYPSKPVTLIVPWPPGGSTDTHMRAFAQIASKYLGQPITVENKPGAGGTLGPGTMAQTAKPDGYTLAQFPISMIRLPHMQKMDFDPIKDFSYVIMLTGYTFGVVVRADSAWKSWREFSDYAKANPGKLSFGSTGTGTSPHLLMELAGQKEGVDFLHVPFKGNAESTQALLGGHIMAQSDATGWGPQVDAGRFRLLVTFGDERTKRWPAVPTAKELGLGIVSYSPYGIVGPRGMNPAIVKVLHDAFRKALYDPEHLKVLERYDQPLVYMDSADYLKWAEKTFREERALIERLGLLAR